MWNESHVLGVFLKIRDRAEKIRFALPLLLHTQSLSSLIDDYSDVVDLLPAARISPEGMNAGRAAILLRGASLLLRDMKGMHFKAKVKGDGTHVEIRVRAL